MASGCKRRSRGFLIRPGELSNLLAIAKHAGYQYADSTCDACSMISYPNYKFYWPIKALGMYMKRHGDEELF